LEIGLLQFKEVMEYIALAKSVRISPRKISLVVDALRGQRLADTWLDSLILVRKRGADAIEKTLKNAVANAVQKGAKKKNLIVKSIEVSPGPALKRARSSTRGRMHPYKKRSSHIRITLMDEKSQITNLPPKARLARLEAKQLANGGKLQLKEGKELELKKSNEKSQVKGAKHGTKS